MAPTCCCENGSDPKNEISADGGLELELNGQRQQTQCSRLICADDFTACFSKLNKAITQTAAFC